MHLFLIYKYPCSAPLSHWLGLLNGYSAIVSLFPFLLSFLFVCTYLRPCPHYVGGIWKQNNHKSFWICVWGKLSQENHMICEAIMNPWFSKKSIFKILLSTWKWKAGIFKLLRFEEGLQKSLFVWRISVDGRPKCA